MCVHVCVCLSVSLSHSLFLSVCVSLSLSLFLFPSLSIQFQVIVRSREKMRCLCHWWKSLSFSLLSFFLIPFHSLSLSLYLSSLNKSLCLSLSSSPMHAQYFHFYPLLMLVALLLNMVFLCVSQCCFKCRGIALFIVRKPRQFFKIKKRLLLWCMLVRVY